MRNITISYIDKTAVDADNPAFNYEGFDPRLPYFICGEDGRQVHLNESTARRIATAVFTHTYIRVPHFRFSFILESCSLTDTVNIRELWSIDMLTTMLRTAIQLIGLRSFSALSSDRYSTSWMSQLAIACSATEDGWARLSLTLESTIGNHFDAFGKSLEESKVNHILASIRGHLKVLHDIGYTMSPISGTDKLSVQRTRDMFNWNPAKE